MGRSVTPGSVCESSRRHRNWFLTWCWRAVNWESKESSLRRAKLWPVLTCFFEFHFPTDELNKQMHVWFIGSSFKLCPVNGKVSRVLSRLHQTTVLISADDFIQGSTVAGVLECSFTVPSTVVMLINNKNDMHLVWCCAMQQDSTIPITRRSESLKCKHKLVFLNGTPVFYDCIENKWKLYSWIFSLIIYEHVKSLSPLMKKCQHC